ncbi:MAG: DUF2911 domain-containing protein [Acidobacteria bacterium]|nr:DUF2911 domain-containing protein [Acidobacteriota bacterium]MBV9478951.1 DUF2911 domain-containing protein [Acidobacteriota bacterium]
MRTLTTLALSLLVATAAFAAEDSAAKKPLSPPAKAEGTIGEHKITVDYSAPSKRGRAIMGGLVPFGKVWRTGANAATTLTTDGDLMIGSLHVPKGTYTLYTIPGEKEWTLIVNKQTGQWGTEYDEKQDLGRTTMTAKKIAETTETFVIAVKPLAAKNGLLTFTWENTEAVVPVMAH